MTTNKNGRYSLLNSYPLLAHEEVGPLDDVFIIAIVDEAALRDGRKISGHGAAQPRHLADLSLGREVGDLAVEHMAVDQAFLIDTKIEHALPDGLAVDTHIVRQDDIHKALNEAILFNKFNFLHIHRREESRQGASHAQRLDRSDVDAFGHRGAIRAMVCDRNLLREDRKIQITGGEHIGQLIS